MCNLPKKRKGTLNAFLPCCKKGVKRLNLADICRQRKRNTRESACARFEWDRGRHGVERIWCGRVVVYHRAGCARARADTKARGSEFRLYKQRRRSKVGEMFERVDGVM